MRAADLDAWVTDLFEQLSHRFHPASGDGIWCRTLERAKRAELALMRRPEARPIGENPYTTGVPTNGTATSNAAAQSLVGQVEGLRLRVLRVFGAGCAAGLPPAPMTCEQVERSTDLKHQTVSARIRELKMLGLLEPSGDVGTTESGRRAFRYRLTPGGAEVLRAKAPRSP